MFGLLFGLEGELFFMSFFLDESQCKITDNTKTVLKLEYPSGL